VGLIVWCASAVDCAALQLASRLQCGNMDASGNKNKRKALLEFLQCYRSLPVLWDTNHVAYNNRQKKSEAYNELLNKFKQVEPNATRDNVVRKINSMRSAFRKELRKVRNSKRMGASANDVYEPSLWYFNELLFLVEQGIPNRGRSTLDEENEGYDNEENTVS
jgi:hypothetical protein